MLVLGIAVAGAAGAVSRFLVEEQVAGRTTGTRPIGTLLINITGSFLLGVLTGLALYHAFPSTPKTILGTGFCGGYTTFSTFAYETVNLADHAGNPGNPGNPGNADHADTRGALLNLVATLVLPAVAAALGVALTAL